MQLVMLLHTTINPLWATHGRFSIKESISDASEDTTKRISAKNIMDPIDVSKCNGCSWNMHMVAKRASHWDVAMEILRILSVDLHRCVEVCMRITMSVTCQRWAVHICVNNLCHLWFTRTCKKPLSEPILANSTVENKFINIWIEIQLPYNNMDLEMAAKWWTFGFNFAV